MLSLIQGGDTMKIGIDIDGTITTPFYWLDFYNKHLKKDIKPKEINTYDHHLAFDISLNTFNRFRNKHLEEIHHLAVPRNQASFYMNKLFFDQHMLHLITAREPELKDLTASWLDKYHFNYHSLYHLGSTQKTQLALKLGLDVFIEDRLETALSMIEWQIPTILFNTPYNDGFSHPLLMRVDTWDEAFKILDSMAKHQEKKPKAILAFD